MVSYIRALLFNRNGSKIYMENITKHQIYRNINEQIQYLYDSKKIIVDVEHYLEERNYISW